MPYNITDIPRDGFIERRIEMRPPEEMPLEPPPERGLVRYSLKMQDHTNAIPLHQLSPDAIASALEFEEVAEYAHKLFERHWKAYSYTWTYDDDPQHRILVSHGHYVVETWFIWSRQKDKPTEEEIQHGLARKPRRR